jgi:hypothetical protein
MVGLVHEPGELRGIETPILVPVALFDQGFDAKLSENKSLFAKRFTSKYRYYNHSKVIMVVPFPAGFCY